MASSNATPQQDQQPYPEYLDCPDHVEELEADEERVEDVVGGEHVDVLLGGVQGGVEHSGGEEVTSRHSGARDMYQIIKAKVTR